MVLFEILLSLAQALASSEFLCICVRIVLAFFTVVFKKRDAVPLPFLTHSLICSQRQFITNITSKAYSLVGHRGPTGN